MTIEDVQPHLRSSYEMLKRAFPDSLDRDDCLTLLSLLHGGFSHRGLAKLMALCFGEDYYSALNDVYFVSSHEYQPNAEARERIKERLLSHGYESWLEEE